MRNIDRLAAGVTVIMLVAAVPGVGSAAPKERRQVIGFDPTIESIDANVLGNDGNPSYAARQPLASVDTAAKGNRS